MKQLRVVLVPIAVALAGMSSGALASTASNAVHAQRVAGPYRLEFQVGPAEKMSMHKRGATGEVMLGGKTASCADSSSSMGGMSMGTAACNRHVEVHVFNRKTGRVVTNAHVSITLSNIGTHKSTQVPIMVMVGANSGSNDVHYGNNLRVGPGRYAAYISVNHVNATVSFRLT